MFDLHDNEILSYEIDLSNERISIKTLNTSNENVDLIFKNVLGYHFENEMKNSIILDIGKYSSINSFIKDYKELLEQRRDYVWPIQYDELAELEEKLISESYSCYFVTPSLGLEGWVLAKSVETSKK